MIETLRAYYDDPWVRRRIREYCGAPDGMAPTCVYVAGMPSVDSPPIGWAIAERLSVERLDTLFERGADIARSTWDVESLLVHFDIDYENVDVPAEAFHHPGEVFTKLEPLYRAAVSVFARFGLPLMALMTGRGYHFTGRVPLDSPVVDRLADLADGPPGWWPVGDRRPPGVTADIPERHARAYEGAGLLAEFLAHKMLLRARPRMRIPVVLNNTTVGSGVVGRECASIDITYAGDPLDMRHIRVAFGAYQKHCFRPDIAGQCARAQLRPFAAVPRGNTPLHRLLSHGRELACAARAARSQSASLPVVVNGVARALDAYGRSALARYHREFFKARRRSAPEGNDLLRSLWDVLPECVRLPLAAPNDLLLQPTPLQHVTRALLAEGLHAREVAAIVQGRYAGDFNWGDRWLWMDRVTRAEFYVRVFAGLAATGVDRGVDFNCVSAQEKGLCPGGICGRDLRANRERLLDAVCA